MLGHRSDDFDACGVTRRIRQTLITGQQGGIECFGERDRRVENDHRLSRSARTARAGETDGVGKLRVLSRARSSSIEGRSATRRISCNRYFESVMPAIAARALSRRCNSLGTLRICTTTVMR